MLNMQQVREVIADPIGNDTITRADALTFSPEGTTYRVSHNRLMVWGLPGYLAFFVAMILLISWTPDSVLLSFAGPLAAGAAVFGIGSYIVHHLPRGPLAPKHVCVADELHEPVVAAIGHLRQMQPSKKRDILLRQLEETLKLVRSASRWSDPGSLIHLHAWAREHIELIDANAHFHATRTEN